MSWEIDVRAQLPDGIRIELRREIIVETWDEAGREMVRLFKELSAKNGKSNE